MTEPARIEVGSVLAGRYRIERVLGQGGMGVVLQATHLQLHQPVAMKLLRPEMLGNAQVVQRFLRESQAAVQLKSEHVARVIDVGVLDAGVPYMVLEYLQGSDLASFPRSSLTVGATVDLVLQACEALAEAHALGIVHRDIKPANFFVTRSADGTWLLKVLDFGISKAPSEDGALTATQDVMGTPAYMSPEQMRSSRDVDHRSDIWSLGIVLYELLQGSPPFSGDTFSAMVLKIVHDPIPRFTAALPGELASVVYRCLDKDPRKRFQDTAQLARALAPYAASELQAAISVRRTKGIIAEHAMPPAGTAGAPAAATPQTTISGSIRVSSAPRSRRRARSVMAALSVAIAGSILAAITFTSRRAERHDDSAAAPPAPPVVVPRAAPPPSPPAAAPQVAPTPPPPIAPAPAPQAQLGEPAPAPPVRKPATTRKAKTTPRPSAPSSAPAEDDVLGTRN